MTKPNELNLEFDEAAARISALSVNNYPDEVVRKWKRERDELLEVMEFYALKRNWGEHGTDVRDWYLIESTDRGDKAREAIAKINKAREVCK